MEITSNMLETRRLAGKLHEKLGEKGVFCVSKACNQGKQIIQMAGQILELLLSKTCQSPLTLSGEVRFCVVPFINHCSLCIINTGIDETIEMQRALDEKMERMLEELCGTSVVTSQKVQCMSR